MSALPILSIEEQELNELLSKANSSPKLIKWVHLFLDDRNKETFGNRTQSAIIAYDLDPIAQYHSAMSMGYQNFRKLQMLAGAYLERKGMTAGRQLDLLAAKAVDSNNAKFMQMMMEISGVYTPKPQVAVQVNTQINANTQLSAQEIETARRDFDEFIEAKYKNSEVVDASSS